MEYITLNSYVVPHVTLTAAVVGSGAAGLACADHLHKLGVSGVAVITEGINMGTSRNTGSDKQTYYKLALTSDVSDSIYELAQTLCEGGSMHGDIALAEAAGSARAFFNLVNLGVPFPANEYGEYVGYRTDHDGGRNRATSCGPLTSRFMTERLEEEVRRDGIQIYDNCRVIEVFTRDGAVAGLLAMCDRFIAGGNPYGLICFSSPSVVWATGGPSAIYSASVYPESQTCSHGAAFLAGAEGRNLTESQYGIAALSPRWNLSGTYQQAIPRYYSIGVDGVEREFLRETFSSDSELFGAVFRKGYEWPFDPRKAESGSSRVDLAVYAERMGGRRVFMDFTREPAGFSLGLLSAEAHDYLASSSALVGTPVNRLSAMNRRAVELFDAHGTDLYSQPVELDVCAQHNNGGFTADIWYESTSLHGFYPIGEASGVFGVTRPGGSALNSTQVGALRAAQSIACRYAGSEIPVPLERSRSAALLDALTEKASNADTIETILARRRAYGARMSRFGAFIRNPELVRQATGDCRAELDGFTGDNSANRSDFGALRELMINYDVLVTEYIYLSAIGEYISHGGISRGSYLIPGRPAGIDPLRGKICRVRLNFEKSPLPEPEFEWEDVRPIPRSEQWFEKVYNRGIEGNTLGGYDPPKPPQ